MLEEVLLPHLGQITGVINQPLDSYKKLGIISKFDRALSVANTDGYPVSAYPYYYDEHQSKLQKTNCIRYEDEFLILIDSLLGGNLLKSPEILRQEIRSYFQLAPLQFEKNYRYLRQQLRRSYRDLPYESKLTSLEEDIVCGLLYDYSADDIEKVLFSLRGLKDYQQESEFSFIAYPAISLDQLKILLEGKYLTAISKWNEIPNKMIFVFYHLNKWHSVRVNLKYYDKEAKYSILIKSPIEILKQANQVADSIKNFICDVLKKTGYQEGSLISEDEEYRELNFITSDLNQLGKFRCSGVVALGNVIDFVNFENSETDNSDFIKDNLFSITHDDAEEETETIQRLQVKAREICQKHLNNTIQWLKDNQKNITAQQEIQLLQELSENYIQVFETALPEKESDINKIYRCLDRAYRFIPDSLPSKYQLICLLILLGELYSLVRKYKTFTQYNQLIEKRDEIFSLLNVDQLFKSFGPFIKWFDSTQLQSAIIRLGRIVGRYKSKNEYGQVIEWQERELALNSDEGFDALKLTRNQVVEILLAKSKDRTVRESILIDELLGSLHYFRTTPSYLKGEDPLRYLQSEIQEKVNKYYQEFSSIKQLESKNYENIRKLMHEKNHTFDGITEPSDKNILDAINSNQFSEEFKQFTETALAIAQNKQNLITNLICDPEIYEKYIACYRIPKGLWLRLPSLKVIAESEKISLRIWGSSTQSIGDFQEIKIHQQFPEKIILPVRIIDILPKKGHFNFLVSSHSGLDVSVRKNKISSEDTINVHISYNGRGVPVFWEESPISALGGSCGFRALGVTRAKVVEILESKVNDPEIREQILCGELLTSLEYHYTNLMNADAIENPPTHFMEHKMQEQVRELCEKIQSFKTKMEEDCNKIRSKLDELKKVLPLTPGVQRTDEIIIRYAGATTLPPECKLLARQLLTDQKEYQTNYNLLKNNQEIYLAYIRSYLHESGLWIGKQTMQIVAQSERIRIHIWGKSSRMIDNFCEIQLEPNNLPEIKEPREELNVLLRRGHFNFLMQHNMPVITHISDEDQVFRLSLLTAEQDHLFRLIQKGRQHSSTDKEYEKILNLIQNLEAQMQKSSPKENILIGQKRAIDSLITQNICTSTSSNKKAKSTPISGPFYVQLNP